MWSKLAVIAALPVTIALAVQAHASPDDAVSNIDPNANYTVFPQDIAYDGIVMDPQEAITDGFAVCALIAPPDGGSLWDAAEMLRAKHPDWGPTPALHFANRAVQKICPNRGSF